jgi:hypothetical protein
MLSQTEHFFVRLLRNTVIGTAGLALLVATFALCVAAYAYLSPEPTLKMTQEVGRLRKATSPKIFISKIFPATSSVNVDIAKLSEAANYKFRTPTDDEIFDRLNAFLGTSIGGEIEQISQLKEWLYGSDSIEFSWSDSIDDKSAKNEDNIAKLWRSLLIDYADRLNVIAPLLQKADNEKLYPTAFDHLTAPTGRSNAPAFLYWYFSTLQTELHNIDLELNKKKFEREELRATIPYELTVAGGAYGYFIAIMFLFLIVSIESSARSIAESQRCLSSAEKPDKQGSPSA